MAKATLARVDRAVLAERLADRGEPPYRAAQIWRWSAGGARGYDEMTNLPKRLRSALADEVPFSTLVLAHQAESRDGTLKALFHTHDGHPVEAGPELTVTDAESLTAVVGPLLRDPAAAQRLAQGQAQALAGMTGTLDATLAALRPYLAAAPG